MSPRKKKTRVKSKARADRMTAKWNDPTKGPDGLTYRERMAKRSKDQREREIAAARRATPPPSPKADPPTPPAPADAPPAAPPAAPPTEKKTMTVRRYGVRFYG